MRALISGFPGPALVVDYSGEILVRNRAAAGVLTVIEPDRERLRGDLGKRTRTLAENGQSDRWLATIDNEETGYARSFLIAAITVLDDCSPTPCVILMGWENTLETSLRRALSESRAFFRDLATTSGDFIWAVDTEGVFTYASPSGFEGRTADQLHGAHWSGIFDTSEDRNAAESIFGSEVAVDERDIWFGSGVRRRCYRMTARPLFAQNGEWQGARGIARDVTELKIQQTELKRVQETDDRLSRILGNIRNEVDPQAMLTTAAASVVDVTGFKGCWIFRRKPDRKFAADSATTLHVVPRDIAQQSVAQKGSILQKLVDEAADQPGFEPLDASDEVWHYLAAPARHAGTVFGILCFGRLIGSTPEEGPTGSDTVWGDVDRQFIGHIADQVAIGIAQVEQHEKLQSLASKDPLTGLTNRQTFMTDATRRLAQHRRMQRRAALLFVDVDDFRSINEIEGSRRGDEVLKSVGDLIASRARDSDLPARFGGDEFTLWLEEADETVAMLKAGDLFEAVTALNKPGDDLGVGDAGPPIGFSIGIAVFDPAYPEPLDSLVHRAETALDEARTSGKGGFRIATPIEGPDCSLELKQNFPDTRPRRGTSA